MLAFYFVTSKFSLKEKLSFFKRKPFCSYLTLSFFSAGGISFSLTMAATDSLQ